MPATSPAAAAAERLAPRWTAFWPGLDVRAAAADVVARLEDAAAVWGLRDLRVLGGGNVALVCAAHRGGRPVVVKVHPRGHPGEAELRAEAGALAFWERTGAVPGLLGSRDDDLTMLLDQVRPGTALDAAGVDFDRRLVELGRLAARLHAAGAPPADALPIAAYARDWREALGGDRESLAELDALLVPAATDVLVHADLHGGNALIGTDGWKAIDPHAARADPHADVWGLLDPLVPPLPEAAADAARTARSRVARYAAAAGLDPARATAWTRVRARATASSLCAAGATPPADRRWAQRLERMADALG
jgi:hypothetical protein